MVVHRWCVEDVVENTDSVWRRCQRRRCNRVLTRFHRLKHVEIGREGKATSRKLLEKVDDAGTLRQDSRLVDCPSQTFKLCLLCSVSSLRGEKLDLFPRDRRADLYICSDDAEGIFGTVMWLGKSAGCPGSSETGTDSPGSSSSSPTA